MNFTADCSLGPLLLSLKFEENCAGCDENDGDIVRIILRYNLLNIISELILLLIYMKKMINSDSWSRVVLRKYSAEKRKYTTMHIFIQKSFLARKEPLPVIFYVILQHLIGNSCNFSCTVKRKGPFWPHGAVLAFQNASHFGPPWGRNRKQGPFWLHVGLFWLLFKSCFSSVKSQILSVFFCA